MQSSNQTPLYIMGFLQSSSGQRSYAAVICNWGETSFLHARLLNLISATPMSNYRIRGVMARIKSGTPVAPFGATAVRL